MPICYTTARVEGVIGDAGNAAGFVRDNINEGKMVMNFGQGDHLVGSEAKVVVLDSDVAGVGPGNINFPGNEMKIGAINAGNAGALGVVDAGLNPSQINFAKPTTLTFTAPAKGFVINAIPCSTIIFQHADVDLKGINNSNGEILDLSLLNPPCEVVVYNDHFEINQIEVSAEEVEAVVEEGAVEEAEVNEVNVNFAALVLAGNPPANAAAVAVAAVEEPEVNVNFAALALADNAPIDASEEVDVAGAAAEEFKDGQFEG